MLVAWIAIAAAQSPVDGFYVDAPSYAPGDTITVHGSSAELAGATPDVRLISLQTPFVEHARTTAAPLTATPVRAGSFVELDDDLAGLDAFTLEGWFAPTLLGGDTVVVAGQHDTAGGGAAAILIDPDGRLGLHLRTTTDEVGAWASETPLPEDGWLHLALRYTGDTVALLVEGEVLVEEPITGAVAASASSLRLGAGGDAPGDLTGCADGRFDSWALWDVVLSDSTLGERRRRGRAEADPDPGPSADGLRWYLPLDDGLGQGVSDRSGVRRGEVVNHGTPSRSGVHPDGVAIRLNHDQVVDAGWPVVATLTVPPTLPSGIYSLQVVAPPDLPEDHEERDLHRVVIVRPAGDDRAPIAAIAPTHTWLAYNDWPGARHDTDPELPTGITPRVGSDGVLRSGGNNSVYTFMGDGVSPPMIAGWRRPLTTGSPFSDTYNHRAAGTARLAAWFRDEGLRVDWYSDADLDAGHVPSGAGTTLFFHGHQEYWTRGMVDRLQAHLADGGNAIAMSGNLIGWRMAPAGPDVAEVEKWPEVPGRGPADWTSGVDGERSGGWLVIDACEGSHTHSSLGTVNHTVNPCSDSPACFGRWEATRVDHWLYGGLDVAVGDTFGEGWIPGASTVGHEVDQRMAGWETPHLAEEPVVLAEGAHFPDPTDRNVIDYALAEGTTCAALEADPVPFMSTVRRPLQPGERSGQIVYWRHRGGGRVLVVGSTDALHALEGPEGVVAGLVRNALSCFTEGACGGETDTSVRPDDAGCGCASVGTSGVAPFGVWVLLLAGRRRQRRSPGRTTPFMTGAPPR